MPESRSTEPLVWIDCEMTGLDTSKDSIMSLACFITDFELNVLDENGYEAVIHHSQEQMDAMGDWCKDHHGASGLTQACLSSSMTAEQAAEELLQYVQKYLHHRILDVSAIKEAARRWAPEDVLKRSPQKAGKHEARADILESIEEARYYRTMFFTGPSA
ncbi:Phosphatidylinositol 3,4,5-trisphosphate-dependent Rac exchanger 2 protein [Saxophila tyrrhenica]|uniref:Phosphatidylinositol 3,4,5-trisphosphate-dependent Rac exchanger 2 protein n=1 Tax=Saxophila tyrrhenica TaxID=1690608 RepID=A0AAV9PD49_9PEZI|nr:Phosphatidylinositol 3,4,5-trisphosphate-dependent Rac exchanger 2 protein [Saxophila tyrrhenica]